MFGYPWNVWYQLVLFVQERRSLENSWGTWSFSPISIGQWAATIPRNVASWPRTLRACLGFVRVISNCQVASFWDVLGTKFGHLAWKLRAHPQSQKEVPHSRCHSPAKMPPKWHEIPCKKARIDYAIFFANSFFMLLFPFGLAEFLGFVIHILILHTFPKWHQPHPTIGIKRYFARIWFAFSSLIPFCPKDLDLNFQDLEYPSLDLAEAPAWIRKNAGPRRSLGFVGSRCVSGAMKRWASSGFMCLGSRLGLKVGRWGGGSMELASNSGNYVLKLRYLDCVW